MCAEKVDLSHEEVWDDSALIISWNEALDEYKKYHSIHAKGGSIRDLELEVALSNEDPEESTNTTADNPVDSNATSKAPDVASQTGSTTLAAVDAPPAALLGTIRDEGLKKLLMSWYYAGYYTGLFEGQQQAQKP